MKSEGSLGPKNLSPEYNEALEEPTDYSRKCEVSL
jgi:hypothetical protein